jgi:hypothetical protein
MEKITEELKTILEQHKLWLNSNGKEGKRADLSSADLRGADLRGADLTDADLSCANLRCANLYYANLRCANLYGANLTGADLTGADLTRANLTYADLYRANLTGADLTGANLYRADFTDANLYRANLTGADLTRANLTGANFTCANLTGVDLTFATLTDTILDEKEQCRKGIVLTEPMIGYKKSGEGKIITLEIPIGAKVFSINNKKRRTNKVKVIDMQGENELSSYYNIDFKYHVGDEIEIKDFDENYNVECGSGIHFFLTREEAENYEY